MAQGRTFNYIAESNGLLFACCIKEVLPWQNSVIKIFLKQ